MISEEKTQTQSAWDEHLEKLRNMSPQQKEEYLARKFEDGQRQARAILGKQAEPSMTREELREMLGKKYPGLTLSDQIIRDRKSGF